MHGPKGMLRRNMVRELSGSALGALAEPEKNLFNATIVVHASYNDVVELAHSG